MVAPEHGTVRVTTLPPQADLEVSVRARDGDAPLLIGATDAAGSWTATHSIPAGTQVALVIEDHERERIRCNVLVETLEQMECLLIERAARTQDQIHAAWRKAYRDQKARGIGHPDPDAVAREAYRHDG